MKNEIREINDGNQLEGGPGTSVVLFLRGTNRWQILALFRRKPRFGATRLCFEVAGRREEVQEEEEEVVSESASQSFISSSRNSIAETEGKLARCLVTVINSPPTQPTIVIPLAFSKSN